MEKRSLLKTMLLLFALIAGSSSVWADTYTLGWGSASGAAGTYTNFDAVSGSVKDIVSFETAKNSSSTNPAYNSTSNELRLYFHSGGSGGSVTLTPAAGVTITGAVVTTSTNPSVKYSVNGGDATSVSASGTDTYTYTVSGISATSSLTFQNVNTTNTQLRIKTIQITYTKVAVTKYKATFNVNGDEISSEEYAEGEDIVFPADPSNIGEKKFMGWTASAIVGTTDVAPAFVSSAKMGTSNATYYAVFASQADVASNTTLTITANSTNVPTSYTTSQELTLEGKKFYVIQMCKNGEKLQWRAAGNANGTGTMYNTEELNNIQSIVLTYDASDTKKNFTVVIGDANNPTSGTGITPSISGSNNEIYTFDCSTYNKNYFVLTNGANAGYLASIAITYEGFVKSYSSYCTTISVPTNVAITIASSGYSTIASGYGLDFANATPAGLEAYVVPSVTASAVSLNAVTEAPASTGIILKGTAGETYTIPVKDGAAAVGTNKLQAAVNPTGIDANSVYILKGGQFCKVTAASIVPAGKAYLLASDVPASAPEYLGFDFGGTTGINAVNGEGFKVNGEYYNLAGQRIAQPTKGLYIVNGKKVIIK